MAKHNIDSQLREHIDGFVAEISALVREAALEAVGQALGAGAGPTLLPGRLLLRGFSDCFLRRFPRRFFLRGCALLFSLGGLLAALLLSITLHSVDAMARSLNALGGIEPTSTRILVLILTLCGAVYGMICSIWAVKRQVDKA